jgi:hypothetical protein
MMKNFTYVLFGIVAMLVFFVPAFVFAQSGTESFGTPGASSGFGTPGASSGSGSGASNQYIIADPLGNKNICQLAKSLLDIVLAIGIPVAVFFLVWSGFRFILARGRPGELEIARKNFYYVIIGIAVFLGAWTLTSILAATVRTLDTNNSIQFCG